MYNGGGVGDTGGDEPWSGVRYRKNHKSRGDGIEWTFLVQNLPDRVTRNILLQAFQRHGYVSDAYVARKRDTKGKCFGFVRFMGVESMKETLAAMNKVRIHEVKLVVSLANYDKNHKKFNYSMRGGGQNEWRPKEANANDRNVSMNIGNHGMSSGTSKQSESGMGGLRLSGKERVMQIR
ncbi:polyadenylate-binding protein 4-like [Helianthus annuus]|uniref:polyadenylate-binding protein 4-like n=1 Tax=Helianthus annuus TaxID=4232 RepID=UPI000B8F0226|nr:polyadenylate-binding protein 4-like [Helianthus annuus]